MFGVERGRRWTDEAKLAFLGEVGMDGWTVADVARHHDVTCQTIYQWRGEMLHKGLWPASDAAQFLPVEMSAAPEVSGEPGGASAENTLVLRNSRQLRCPDGIGDAALVRLVQQLETALSGRGPGCGPCLACGATDLRKGIAGLAALAQD